MNELEQEIFSKVLANEATCRIIVDQLISHGVTFSVDPKSLTHDELIEVMLVIYSELARNERLATGDEGGE